MSGNSDHRTGRPDLEHLIDSWRDWDLGLTDRPRLIEPIKSGRTNENYRLGAPGLKGDLLLRINHPEPARLGIDRELERKILAWTADAGIGRSVWYWDPEQRFVIFPFLPGRTWTKDDLDNPEQLDRLWPMIERLHQMTPDWPRRRYHAYLCHYWRQLEQAGAVDTGLRKEWQEFEPRLKAFDASPWSARLVHHDLVPDNILETDNGLYLIDWEYAAPGHSEIDIWTVDPAAVTEPFVAEMMGWINSLWERLMIQGGNHRP